MTRKFYTPIDMTTLNKVVNIADPTNWQDAVTKAYVNSQEKLSSLHSVDDMLVMTTGYAAGNKALASLGATSSAPWVIDGNNTNDTETNDVLPYTITVTLDREYAINQFALYWAAGFGRLITACALDWSLNGVSGWTTVLTFDPQLGGWVYDEFTPVPTTYTIPLTTARYWRLQVTAGSAWHYIGELQLLSVALSPAPTALASTAVGRALLTAASAAEQRTALGVDSIFTWMETPGGVINGVNDTFTLAVAPIAGKLMLYKNGILQLPGASNDYTISGLTITFLAGNIPQTDDVLLATYQH